MKLPSVTIKHLLEAGVHLGHKTFRWNPKMSSFIFGSKNSIHIIDLTQTLELINVAYKKFMHVLVLAVKFYLFQLKNKLQILLQT